MIAYLAGLLAATILIGIVIRIYAAGKDAGWNEAESEANKDLAKKADKNAQIAVDGRTPDDVARRMSGEGDPF